MRPSTAASSAAKLVMTSNLRPVCNKPIFPAGVEIQQHNRKLNRLQRPLVRWLKARATSVSPRQRRL
jgi:hypothetical protein